jgi:Outer membrane protein beta-barrel family/CarboxypepD_reg-like domain/TonB-dependent Receptor Plug Domain
MQKIIFKLLIIFSFYSFGQNGEVTGIILDKKTNESIPYATIVIQDGEKIESGGVSNEKGKFSIDKLPLKKLKISFQFIGYSSVEKEITLSAEKRKIDFGKIYLQEDVTQLKEVEVVGEQSSIVQKIDRKVINVGKDLINAGPTASDLLNNIPSVSVDNQTNAVSLRGNSNVQIFIDGKPSQLSPAQALQQIPSTSIKSVELITNPSAKFNPEGMSGIINIVLKKNSNLGFNGSINLGTNIGITPKGNGSLDLNYRVNKFNIYSTLSSNIGRNFNFGYLNTTNRTNTDLSNKSDFGITNYNKNFFTKTGIDFYINEKNTVSFFTIQSVNRNRGSFSSDVDYFSVTNPDIFQYFENTTPSRNQTYNFQYKKVFDKDNHTLEFEANYNENLREEDSQFYFGRPLVIADKNDIETLGRNLIFNLDYVNPLTDKSKLEAGLESRTDKTDNDFLVNRNYFSDFTYERNIYSAYTNFGQTLGKWNYQVGARLEYFEAFANFRRLGQGDGKFEDEIFTVYPSAFVTYTKNDKNSYNMSYSRRVDRPSIGQVNPIRDWSSPTVDQEGNPFLVPQFTNSLEFNYTRTTKIGAITAGTFFRYINDRITQVWRQSPYDANKRLMSYGNFDNNINYGFEVSGNLTIKKWWSMNFGVDVYVSEVSGIVEDVNNNLVTKNVITIPYNGRMNHTFKVNKTFTVTYFAMYRGPVDDLQFNSEDMWRMDLGVRKDLFKGKGSISVRMNDIFNTMRARFNGENPDLVFGQFRWESRMLNVNFNYRFGAGKNRALQRKNRDKNETQGGGFM